MKINKTELIKIIMEQAGELAERAVETIRVCGDHKSVGHILLKIKAKPKKSGKLVVDSEISFKEPMFCVGSSGVENEFRTVKLMPVLIATMDMDEEPGQERIDL